MAARVTEAPVTETPVAETQGAVVETPAAPSDMPAPIETGITGDGQSWAKRAEAGICEEFQQDRPTKHHWLQSKQ